MQSERVLDPFLAARLGETTYFIAVWDEQRAAYFARRGMVELGQAEHSRVVDLIGRIKAIWDKWQQMSGDNPPLVRDTAGPRRDFDINIDGMVHYGMLPDLLQDVRNVGLDKEDLAPLFRGANDYIEMWETCERQAEKITAKAEKKTE